ncbi:MAG TPA: SRPBCC domain-containing protein [Caulobacteraceae bacterium]|jgi:uncharacterized protein YndB with AHSA1/START domain|nr:SRPBCC domain-containing protein [Caulobacteraceae bacterium]
MTETIAATRSVVIEQEMPHPPEKVWRALTQQALIAEWLMDNDFEAEVGHRFRLRAEPAPNWNGIVEGEVLTVEPHQRLVYTWGSGGDQAASAPRTVVTWTLTPSQAGTLLRMEQSGFRPQDEAGFKGASFGWRRFLGALERVLANLA